MTAEEKSVLSLFMIGVLIVVGKVLAGGEPITPRLFIGRMLLGGFVSMVAGVVLVQFPDLSLPAVCGIGSMLGIAGYQVIEIAIQRRFKGTLDNPVKRGEQVIEQVTLMKPNAGTLRGVSLAAVANSEVDALIKVLPRMTAPMLTEQEVAALELPDLVALAGKVVGFLSPNSVQ